MEYIYSWLQAVGLIREDPPPVFPSAVRYSKGDASGKIMSLADIYRVPPLPSERYATAYSSVTETEIILGEGSFGTCRLVKLLSPTPPITTTTDENDNSTASTRTRGSFSASSSSVRLMKQSVTEYACKSIPKVKTTDGTDFANRAILQEEVYNLCRCQGHPNIVKLVDVIEDRGHVHLVMEVCKGGELYSKVIEAKTKRKKAAAHGTTKSDDGSKVELNGGLDEGVAVKIVHQILSAICHCHDRNVAHRDLKASNFLFKTKEPPGSLCGQFSLALHWTLRIIDFGLSKYVPPSSSRPPAPTRSSTVLHPAESGVDDDYEDDCSVSNDNDDESRSRIDRRTTKAQSDDVEKSTEKTVEASIASDIHDEMYNAGGYMTSEVGTPFYTAPEVLTQDEYNLKCDVWAVGVVAYLLLSGNLPVLGKDERETVKMLMDRNLTVNFDANGTSGSVWRENGPISSDAREFCQALLQRDPNERPTAREALELDWMTKHFGPPPEGPNKPILIRDEDIVLPFRSKCETGDPVGVDDHGPDVGVGTRAIDNAQICS